jgi:hypothetical protein
VQGLAVGYRMVLFETQPTESQENEGLGDFSCTVVFKAEKADSPSVV